MDGLLTFRDRSDNHLFANWLWAPTGLIVGEDASLTRIEFRWNWNSRGLSDEHFQQILQRLRTAGSVTLENNTKRWFDPIYIREGH